MFSCSLPPRARAVLTASKHPRHRQEHAPLHRAEHGYGGYCKRSLPAIDCDPAPQVAPGWAAAARAPLHATCLRALVPGLRTECMAALYLPSQSFWIINDSQSISSSAQILRTLVCMWDLVPGTIHAIRF